MGEALRIKKKIEGDINEMEISLDHANKANVETSKQIKRLANNLLEIDTAAEEEARARADIEDQIGISERKANVLSSEVEEARLLLDTAERARKHAEIEVGDVREAIASVGTANSILATDKRRLEGDLRGMQQELDNFMSQIKNSEEKTKKAMADAGRLADELRTEQEHGLAADKNLKTLSAQS